MATFQEVIDVLKENGLYKLISVIENIRKETDYEPYISINHTCNGFFLNYPKCTILEIEIEKNKVRNFGLTKSYSIGKIFMSCSEHHRFNMNVHGDSIYEYQDKDYGSSDYTIEQKSKLWIKIIKDVIQDEQVDDNLTPFYYRAEIIPDMSTKEVKTIGLFSDTRLKAYHELKEIYPNATICSIVYCFQ